MVCIGEDLSKTSIRPFEYVPEVPEGGMTVTEFCGWLEQWKTAVILAYSKDITKKEETKND